MNQTVSWTSFGTGFTTFVGIATELVTEHTQWSDFKTPLGVLHLIVLGAAFTFMIVGALGVQLPRSGGNDRVSDNKLKEINNAK